MKRKKKYVSKNLGLRKRRRRKVPNLGLREVYRTWTPKQLRSKHVTKRMQALDEEVYNGVLQVASEIQKSLKLPEDDFWGKAVPLALLRTFSKFDHLSVYKACNAFINTNYEDFEDEDDGGGLLID